MNKEFALATCILIISLYNISCSFMTLGCYYNRKKDVLEKSNFKISLSINLIFGFILLFISVHYMKLNFKN